MELDHRKVEEKVTIRKYLEVFCYQLKMSVCVNMAVIYSCNIKYIMLVDIMYSVKQT